LPVSLAVRGNSFRGCSLLTGFHGVGGTGYIAVSYLVHALEARRIGFVEVDHPPPYVATSETGLITPFEVYRSGRLVFVKQEFQPHRSEESQFAKALARWAIEGKFRDAILVGGLDSSLKSGKQRIRVLPTQAYLSKRIDGLKYPTLEPGLFVYGQLAVMLSEFEKHNFPAIAILPYASTSNADPAAAALAVRSICKAFKLRVDVSDLEIGAREIESELTRRMDQAKRLMHGMYG
jgi:predicted ATP-grasp superfamily ATP-dependent carboligase